VPIGQVTDPEKKAVKVVFILVEQNRIWFEYMWFIFR
jgi:hypothetical protein